MRFPFFKNGERCVLLVEGRVEGVEVARVKMVLRDAKRIAKPLIMHDLALTQVAQRITHVGIVAQTNQVVIGRTRLLLC